MKRTTPLFAALALAGCASFDSESATASGAEFLLLAAGYGATIDGQITEAEAIPYARAAVETFGNEIPVKWVGTVAIACTFIAQAPDLDLPELVGEFCTEVVANIPAPA